MVVRDFRLIFLLMINFSIIASVVICVKRSDGSRWSVLKKVSTYDRSVDPLLATNDSSKRIF
jgi:hypothetical protein